LKNILFSLSALGILLTQTSCANIAQPLSQEEFIKFSKQASTVVIDVRTPKEYAKGHVPGAINYPHKKIVSGELAFDSFNDKNLVFYCQSGFRASIVNKYLDKNLSFSREQLFHLKGDFRAWKANGRTVIKP